MMKLNLTKKAIALAVTSTLFVAFAPAGTAGQPSVSSMMSEKGGATGIMMPMMNASNGQKLFASKGCVVCHSVNGVGGTDAPPMDAKYMASTMMNPLDFAARMWRGAGPMIAMQQKELNGQIQLTGAELGDIIAFVHSPSEQSGFSEEDIPKNIKEKMEGD